MTKSEQHLELKNKLLYGLKKTYENLIEFKKQKKSTLVVIRDGQIVELDPNTEDAIRKSEINNHKS